MGEPIKFLFTMWDGGGTVPPELGVAKRLVARGHSVRVLADPVIEDEARTAGCAFSPWTTAPHRTTRHRSGDIIRDYDAGSPLKMMATYMKLFLAEPAPRWAADTLAELEARPVDVFVTDQMLPATNIAAEKLGLPRAAISPQIWMLPTPGLPPLGTGLRPAGGPFGRMREAGIRWVMTRLFDKALPAFNATRASYGLPPVRSTFEQMLRVDATYVLTSPAFDFTTKFMPKNVFYAGPVLDDPSWSEPWRSPWEPGDKRPLVLVGLSSQYQKQAGTLQRIVDALAMLPVRALVTLGTALSPDEVRGTENVVVVRSAPHAEVLRDASLLVTHCGHGTVMKGLVAGVPLLCVPMGRDQNDNAVRIVERGAGLCVKPTATVNAIGASVERLLREPAYRDAARRLGAAIAGGDGCVDVVQSLERLARGRSNARPAEEGAKVKAAHGNVLVRSKV
jgi:MGT family glycosyltransferase